MTNPLMQFAGEKRWVNWKLETRDGKETKIPYQPNNIKASTTDPATWSVFKDLHKNGFNGPGIVFTPDKLLLGVDGDHILASNWITDDAFDRFVTAADTYTEISQSSTGLHVFLMLTEPLSLDANSHQPDKKSDVKYECYTSGRYFTTTFKPYLDKPIRRVTPDEAIKLLGILGYPWGKIPAKPAIETTPLEIKTVADADLLHHIFTAPYGADFKKLHDGDISAYGNDDSSADMAFCDALAKWTKDAVQIERIWMSSRLGSRDKTQNRKAYRDTTIAKALTFSTNGAHEPDIPIDHALILRRARLTDVGNAECLEALHGDKMHYCHTRDRWLIWNGEIHQLDTNGQAWRLMLETIRLRQAQISKIEDEDFKKRFSAFTVGSENERKLQSALTSASKLNSIATTIDLYDKNPMLVNAGSVTIDLKTVSTRKNEYSDYITRRLGTDYDVNAICPRWVKFLNEIFSNDQTLISYIARAIGYSLTGDTREQIMFLCYGAGSNGKSVFLTTIARLLGEYAESRSFATFDADERNRVGDDLAGLKGSRLLTVIETAEDKRLNEARVKSLTGQDVINCRFLFGEYFSFRPEFKLWIAFNNKPTVRGTDRGIWRRIQLIPFNQNYEGKEDKTLDCKLQNELSGILNWALAGLRDWHQKGLHPPAIVTSATDEYRREMDVVSAFIDEMCNRHESARSNKGILYEKFIHWTGSKNNITKVGFGKQLRLLGITEGKIASSKQWHGIELASQDDERGK